MEWESLAVIGGLAVIGVDRLLAIFRSRGIDLHRMAKNIDDLHRWHNKEDGEGVKIWYLRPSLEKAIMSLSENINNQTKLLSAIHEEYKELSRTMRELTSKIDK